jgi:hypothetical protein
MKTIAIVLLLLSAAIGVIAQDESNWLEPDPIIWEVCEGAAEEPLAFARAGFKSATPKFKKGTTPVSAWLPRFSPYERARMIQ